MEDNDKENKLPELPKEEKEESEPKEYNKVIEVFKGMGIGTLVGIVASLVVTNNYFTVTLLVVYIGLIIYFYSIGRRGIGLGLIILVCIPLVIFGGCLLVIMNN